jgi:hypothetical protein
MGQHQAPAEPAFSPYLYRYRNLVERFFNKIKHYRAVATRYDKRARKLPPGVKLASLRIWMRFNELMTCVLRRGGRTTGRLTATSLLSL